jgi:ADP-ribosylglycohydrolase
VKEALAEGHERHRVFLRLGMGGVAVQNSLSYSIYSFAANPKSFERALNCAAELGGDADTMAAMACAISGAYLGLRRIPRGWVEKLENRGYMETLLTWLYELKTEGQIRCAADDFEKWKAEKDKQIRTAGDDLLEELEHTE